MNSGPHVLTPSLLIKDYHYHQDRDDDIHFDNDNFDGDNFDDYYQYDLYVDVGNQRQRANDEND